MIDLNQMTDIFTKIIDLYKLISIDKAFIFNRLNYESMELINNVSSFTNEMECYESSTRVESINIQDK